MRKKKERVSVTSKVESKDKSRNVHIQSPVSLELPGNLKVWLETHCQVIIAVKQSVSFYNDRRKKREIQHKATKRTEKRDRFKDMRQ